MQHSSSVTTTLPLIEQLLISPSNWHHLEAACCAVAQQMQAASAPLEVSDELDRWANRVQRRLCGDDPLAVLAHLHDVLFEEMALRGNLQSYYVIDNLLIDSVVRRREGMPVMLCLVYQRIADRLGVTAQGLNMPGHFLLRVRDPWGWLVVDPFCRGRVLDEEQAIHRLSLATQWSVDDLRQRWRAATPVEWFRRILLSLEHALDRCGWYEKLDFVKSLLSYLPTEDPHSGPSTTDRTKPTQ